jgi:hypothetical protein
MVAFKLVPMSDGEDLCPKKVHLENDVSLTSDIIVLLLIATAQRTMECVVSLMKGACFRYG